MGVHGVACASSCNYHQLLLQRVACGNGCRCELLHYTVTCRHEGGGTSYTVSCMTSDGYTVQCNCNVA